tara:strand:- start:19717 stop:22521 length:2805 start_codon:yes stop_codon:yes gene_type:complete
VDQNATSDADLLSVLKEEAQRLELSDPAPDNAEALPRFREFLEFGRNLAQANHREGLGGLAVCRILSSGMDVLIQELHKRVESRWKQTHTSVNTPMAMLGLGGYGRSELCPFSDIDLMFVYPDKARASDFKSQQAFFNDGILYILWDLGLKVGHSTRNPKEAVAEAVVEVQSKNAMLESRLVTGDAALAKHFRSAFSTHIRKENLSAYIEERLNDQKARRSRFSNTVFLQEPDIKNGVGGLRDYQNIVWIVRLKLNREDFDPLRTEKLIDEVEYAGFVGAYDFLLRVRNELHFSSTRATDLLNLEKQPQIAEGLGWSDDDIFRRVEQFMREYYKAAKTIYETSHILEQRLFNDSQSKVTFSAVVDSLRRGSRAPRIDVFELGPTGLVADNPMVFRENPIRLIRVFRIRQKLRCRFSLELTKLVTEGLDLIDEDLRHAPEANKAFRSILQTRGEVSDTLRAMHRTGVLGRFLPEWAELECLVQHEFYHRYTADEHTLATIDQLDAIFRGDNALVTQNYREAIERTDLPGLLYLVLLLHDIGKGRGIKGHAEVGAELAKDILKRLQVAESVRSRILFLIRGHLEMARFWQHYDIDEARTIRKFASWVDDVDQLRYLFVLTYCDAQGTSVDIWNSYKDSLHTQLYRSTLDAMGETARVHYEMISKDEITAFVPGISADEIEAHFNLLPERYFVYSSAEEVALHLRMVHQLLETIAESASLGSLEPVVEWREDVDLGLMVVHVVTWDRAGLFCKLAGAFGVAGLSIVSSRALTRADHITIDTFYISGSDGQIVRDPAVKAVFSKAISDVLLHNRDLLPAIELQEAKLKKSAYLRTEERLRAPLPFGVDVYHELSLRRTIVELQATDQIGLLYRLARTIYGAGFDITFARIATERNVAVDTFYIEPIDRSKDSSTMDLLDLRRQLSEVVETASQEEESA